MLHKCWQKMQSWKSLRQILAKSTIFVEYHNPLNFLLHEILFFNCSYGFGFIHAILVRLFINGILRGMHNLGSRRMRHCRYLRLLLRLIFGWYPLHCRRHSTLFIRYKGSLWLFH